MAKLDFVSTKEEELLSAIAGPEVRDPIYFAEEVLGLRLNPGQKRWFALVRTLEGSSWQWLYKRVVHVAANQVGKSLGLAVLIIWACHTKMGIRNNDWDSWLARPYRWYHLAPTHPQALLVYKDMGSLLAGSHPAQYDRDTGQRRRVLWPVPLSEAITFDGDYPGYRLWNGAEINFRTTADGAKGIQGVVANGVSIDEAAFEDRLNEILNQAVKMRLIASGGPLWLVSTPNGINDYFEVVQSILDNSVETGIRVWESSSRRMALCWSHVQDNVGYGLTQEEVDFMEEDVDPATKEQQLRGAFLEPKDAFFVPIPQIQEAFQSRLPDRQKPMLNHKYVIFWDISVQSDPTVVIILDTTRKPYVGVYFQRWEKPMGIGPLLEEMYRLHAEWNTRAPGDTDPTGFAPRAITGFDSTSMGGALVRQMLTRLSPKHPLNFAGNKVKLNALTNLRASLSRKEILLPSSWTRLMREILGYRLEDQKIVQDCVMATAGAAHIAITGFSGAKSKPFNMSYRNFASTQRSR